jgi:hypothetical protein
MQSVQVFHNKTEMPKIMKPMSNWHRMLHLLDLNGGTLYKAQLYVPKTDIIWDSELDSNSRIAYTLSTRKRPDHLIKTDGMPKMTNVSAMKPTSYAYEERGHKLGLVFIQRYNNRKYITLLPKGRDILNRFFRQDLNWEVQ